MIEDSVKPQTTKAICQKHGLPIFLFDGFIGCTKCYQDLKKRDRKRFSFKKQVLYAQRKKRILQKNHLVECPYHPGVIYAFDQYCDKCYVEVKNELI